MEVEKQSSLARWLRILTVGRNPKFTLLRIALLVVTVFIIRAYVLLPIRILGPSMMPTYQENGVNFVNRLAYLRSEPQRGDVVAIRYAGEHRLLMKRVIGLPGETIEFRRGQVFIDGTLLPEPYLATNYPSFWTIPPKVIEPGRYYVVGDNRTMPEASHVKGQAERRRIVGKILLCKNWFASSSSRR
jgi:signal peptidase I